MNGLSCCRLWRFFVPVSNRDWSLRHHRHHHRQTRRSFFRSQWRIRTVTTHSVYFAKMTTICHRHPPSQQQEPLEVAIDHEQHGDRHNIFRDHPDMALVEDRFDTLTRKATSTETLDLDVMACQETDSLYQKMTVNSNSRDCLIVNQTFTVALTCVGVETKRGFRR